MFGETLLSLLPLNSLIVGENIEEGLSRPFSPSLLFILPSIQNTVVVFLQPHHRGNIESCTAILYQRSFTLVCSNILPCSRSLYNFSTNLESSLVSCLPPIGHMCDVLSNVTLWDIFLYLIFSPPQPVPF